MPGGKHFASEVSFTTAVVDLFKMAGWYVHHDRGEMRKHIQGHVGFPDIIAVHPRLERMVAAELKMPKGRTGIEQLDWLHAFERIGCPDECSPIEVHVWRPDDWDEIVKVATNR